MARHSKLGASIAHRWMKCPGSVRMAEAFAEESGSSPYAREGTAAHTLAQLWLQAGEQQVIELRDSGYPFLVVENDEIEVDDEMVEHVRVYVDAVQAAHREVGGQLVVERKVQLKGMDGVEEKMFGTPDAIVFSPAARTLRVFDLKYGQGVLVEVVGNPQPLYYAYGAWQEMGEPELDDISVTIVQPRADHPHGPVRTVTIEMSELMDFAAELHAAALRTQDADAPLVPGKWCRFCPAHAQCPAVYAESQAVARVEFEAMPLDRPPTPESLPLDVVADILNKAPILEEWLNALRQRVQRELEVGREVEGFKLVAKRATRKWTSEEEKVREWYVKNHGALEDLYDVKLKSPAQVEKLVGKKPFQAAGLATAVSSGVTLVPASDPRPAAAIGPRHDFPALGPGSIDNS